MLALLLSVFLTVSDFANDLATDLFTETEEVIAENVDVSGNDLELYSVSSPILLMSEPATDYSDVLNSIDSNLQILTYSFADDTEVGEIEYLDLYDSFSNVYNVLNILLLINLINLVRPMIKKFFKSTTLKED